MDQSKVRRNTITILFIGILLILILVPWVIDIISFVSIKSLQSPGDLIFKSWFNYGYINSVKRTLSDHNTLVGAGIASLLLIIGLLTQVKFENLKGGMRANGRWGPAAAGNGEYGTARFQSQEEMKQNTTQWEDPKPLKEGGITLGIDLRRSIMRKREIYYIDTTDTHVLVIGATRSGKTRRVLMPNIWALAHAGESMVLTDPKGELFLSTAPYLRSKGYEIVQMNFREPEKSDFWNPMEKIKEAVLAEEYSKADQTARELADALVTSAMPSSSNPFWPITAKGVIKTLSLLQAVEAPEDAVNMYAQNVLIDRLGEANPYDDTKLSKLIKSLPMSHPARMSWSTAGIAPTETRGNIFASALSAIEIFTDRKIAAITSTQNHDLKMVGQKKTAVYLIIPDEVKIYNVLATIYINQLYQSLAEVANKNGGLLPVRVNFLLDEFGNLPAIVDFDTKLTVGGGRRIRFIIAIQGIKQIDKLYRDVADTITGNCHTWIYLSTADQKTAQLLEKRAGPYTIKTDSSGTSSKTTGYDDNTTSSHNQNLAGRSLIQANEIQMQPLDSVLVFRDREQPAEYPTPELSHLKASKDYGLGTRKQTALTLQKRNEDQPIHKLTYPSYWLPDVDEFESAYSYTGSVEIHYTDKDTDEYISGGMFCLINSQTGESRIGMIVTGESVYRSVEIEAADYSLIQLTPATGYDIADKKAISVKIEYEGQVVKIVIKSVKL